MFDFPVDIVYTWVDGSDCKWAKKKQEALNNYSIFHNSEEVSGESRFTSRDELKYSLRSIEKYAPWVRKIFIITDNQIPKWLNINNKKIKIIDHNELFDSNDLPCFNSNAIEACIHRIENLSDNFLSFNDDFFIGRMTNIDDFFIDKGKPKLFTGKKIYNFNIRKLLTADSIIKQNPHQFAILNARIQIHKNNNFIVNYNLRHGIKAMNKTNLINLERKFPKCFEETRKNKFRDNSDVWVIALDAFHSIAIRMNDPFYLKPYRGYYSKYQIKFIRKDRDYIYLPLNLYMNRIKSKIKAIKTYGPLMFCINDVPNVTNDKYRIIDDFLQEYYSEKSEFEK